MAKYILEAKSVGTFSLFSHTNERITLKQGDKHEIEIDRLTTEILKFYRNYRVMGVDFYQKRVEKEVPKSAEDVKNPVGADVKTSDNKIPTGVNPTSDANVPSSTEEVTKPVDNSTSDVGTKTSTVEEIDALKKYTKAELLLQAKEKGIVDVNDTMTKEQIIAKLV